MWAIFNDLIQRIITLNKWEQRRNLKKRVRSINLPKGSKVLDFGCGTALFTNVFKELGLNYYGYDIDTRLISYARHFYKGCQFVATKDELKYLGPFDLILANCCFHHIDTMTLFEELKEIKHILDLNGTFMMIDILLQPNDAFLLRSLFKKLEVGAYIRSYDDYRKIIEKYFRITKSDIERSHLFSIKRNPVYNDLCIIECKI
jgi:SAM-dependent methyltransferase